MHMLDLCIFDFIFLCLFWTICLCCMYFFFSTFLPKAVHFSLMPPKCCCCCEQTKTKSYFNNLILIFNVSLCVCEQQALQEAQEDLAVTQQILNEAKEKLAAVEEGIATLQAKYHECLSKRDELDAKCQLCENRLIRADKVSGEKPSHLSNFPFNSL